MIAPPDTGPRKRKSRPIARTALKKRLTAISMGKVTSRLQLVKMVETLRRKFWQGELSARQEIVKILEGAL